MIPPDPDTPRGGDANGAAEVDAVMAASRAIVALTARSLAGTALTLPQLRVLAFLSEQSAQAGTEGGAATLGAVAAVLRVHPSNATRTCDRLVAAGLLDRRDNPADRRHLLLTLTDAGRELVHGVMDRRRAAIGQILRAMPAADRAQLATVLTRFAQAGGEPQDTDLWAVGWTTESPSSTTGPGPIRGRPEREHTG